MRAWLTAAAGLVDGPLFVGLTPQGGLRSAALGDRMVAHVLKRHCKSAGIDPDGVDGPQSATRFCDRRRPSEETGPGDQAPWTVESSAMLDRYIEDGNRWDDNATVGLGF